MATAQYDPSIFNAANVEAAKQIILTPEGQTTAERWERETPYLAGLIEQELDLSPQSVLLDFGCGIGRLAKEMIARTGCRVVGVDISPDMRALAPSYVTSDRFLSCGPDMLLWMIERGITFDAAIAVWALQHVARLDLDLTIIQRALRKNADLFIVNERHRCVPVVMEDGNRAWAGDGVDVAETVRKMFGTMKDGGLDPEVVGEAHAQSAYWAIATNDR